VGRRNKSQSPQITQHIAISPFSCLNY